jgi:hypothetical protein
MHSPEAEPRDSPVILSKKAFRAVRLGTSFNATFLDSEIHFDNHIVIV